MGASEDPGAPPITAGALAPHADDAAPLKTTAVLAIKVTAVLIRRLPIAFTPVWLKFEHHGYAIQGF